MPLILPTNEESLLTAVKRVDQDMNFPQYVVGGRRMVSGVPEYKLFKKTEFLSFHIWRSAVFQIDEPFDVTSIVFPIVPSAEMAILPVLRFDNETVSSAGTEINQTNYPGKKLIHLTPKNFGNKVHGKYNFFLELQFTNFDLAVVCLPINIEIDKVTV